MVEWPQSYQQDRTVSVRGRLRVVTIARIYWDTVTIASRECVDVVMEQLDIETCLIRDRIVRKYCQTGCVADQE